MTDASEWKGRVGTSWAEEWRRTDRTFTELTARLLDSDALGTFAAALDIGCGAGELACELARRAPHARVLGIDIAPQLVEVARQRGAGLPNLAFECVDAGAWQSTPATRPDLLLSRHGVMFFAEPVRAFAHLAGEAAPGARLRFSCFRAVADNEWAQAVTSILPGGGIARPTQPTAHAPGPFAFADRDHVHAILGKAGWKDIAFEAVDYAMLVSPGTYSRQEAVAAATSYFLRIGPAARALAQLDQGPRAEVQGRLAELLSGYYAQGRVALPAAAWIVTARVE